MATKTVADISVSGKTRISRLLAVLSIALAPGAWCLAAGAPDAPAGTTIVAVGGYWRDLASLAPPVVSADQAKAAGLDDAARTIRKSGLASFPLAAPADGWAEAAFDDASWPRQMGPFTTGNHEVAAVFRRARFLVADPAKVSALRIALGYRGGLIVRLNGKELLRASLPPGKLGPTAPAEDYPNGAFFAESGPNKGKLLHSYNDRDLKEQFALRERSASADVPATALRQGMNVLSLEVHRSGYPAQCRQAGLGEFVPIGITRLALTAQAEPGAVASAVDRPPGVQVWTPDIPEEVYSISYGSPGERPAISIVGARNGAFSGKLVVSSTAEIKSLSVKVGPLLGAGGAKLPPEAVSLRYGIPGQSIEQLGGSVYGGPTGPSPGVQLVRFDGLVETAPASVPVAAATRRRPDDARKSWSLPDLPAPAAVQPVWVTVRVPKDAPAGVYTGQAAVSADGAADLPPVPIQVDIAGWTLPDVKDYVGQMSIYQSPDTLAAYYKAPPWSDKHWGLIEQSVRLLGGIGNHTIICPLLAKEQGGNEQGYVVWVKQADGSFTYDTALLERYVDLYLKHHDRARIMAICCTVWGNAGVAAGNPYQKEKYDEKGLPVQTRGQLIVTCRDAGAGALTDMPVPPLGSRQFEDFWRPALKLVQQKLADRGLAGKMMYGMPADPPIPAAVVAAFRNILPEAGWFVGNHPGLSSYNYDRSDYKKAVPVLHCERVYTGPIPDPREKRQFGWRRKDMTLAFNRYGFAPLCLFPTPRAYAFRIAVETDLASDHRGPGRIGADYWHMGTGSDSGGAGTFYMRYPASSIGQTGMAANYAALLAPGPDGPVTTLQFENLREGAQTAEAVIFIEKALLDGKPPAPAADKYWAIIDDRINALRQYSFGLGQAGWQQRDRGLYRAAAELAKN